MLSDIDQSMASITCVVDFLKPSITSGNTNNVLTRSTVRCCCFHCSNFYSKPQGQVSLIQAFDNAAGKDRAAVNLMQSGAWVVTFSAILLTAILCHSLSSSPLWRVGFSLSALCNFLPLFLSPCFSTCRTKLVKVIHLCELQQQKPIECKRLLELWHTSIKHIHQAMTDYTYVCFI